MGFEEFLPADNEEDENLTLDLSENSNTEKIGSDQLYEVITGRQPEWQTIIYDLINSEQLDPWDIDLIILTKRFFEKILELEEQDFYISSKVLLAASLLLRIKSEILLNKHIKSIDEILFGKKEDKKYIVEKIQINEDDLPLLIPKTPLPRSRRVTLTELMAALSKAINTETRRIKKEVAVKRAKKLSEVDFPSFRRIDLKDRIKHFYAKILTSIKKIAVDNEKNQNKVCYANLIGIEREEKVACFLPLLHLSNTKKLWLEQEKHLDDIWIFLYEYFDKNRHNFKEELEADIDEIAETIVHGPDEEENVDIPEDALKKAQKAREKKRQLADEARRELEKELGWDIGSIEEQVIDNLGNEISQIEKEEKIDSASGF